MVEHRHCDSCGELRIVQGGRFGDLCGSCIAVREQARHAQHAAGYIERQEHAEWIPVLTSIAAQQTLSPLEYRILRHLYAGMPWDWICDTLDCRVHDITRAQRRAQAWLGRAS